MSDTFVSGNLGPNVRADCQVTFTPKASGGKKVLVDSRVEVLYGDSIRDLAKKTLSDLKINHCQLEIKDAGAAPFVIAARIEATTRMAYPEADAASLPEFKEHCTYSSSRDRFRRSRLYLPGNQPRLMLNAGIHKPDGIILDLEDSVAPSEKLSARLIVRNALRVLDFFGAERMVRVNQGELGFLDLEAIIPHNVHLVLLPKVETAAEVKTIDAHIQKVAKQARRKDPVFLMPILESAKGILNALAVAEASKNNVALAIGLEDYTADLGTQRTLEGRESFFARSMLVNAARAAHLQAIDTVFSDVSDMEGLRASVFEAKTLGFDGKGCIHPRQIRVIHEAFCPDAAEIQKAQKIVLAFEEAEARGLGVVSLGTKMIDPPVVKRALHTVQLAVSSGILASNWKANIQETKS